LLYVAIAVIVAVAGLFLIANTLIGGFVLGMLLESVIAMRSVYLAVSAAGGVVGCVLGKLSGGSWKRGARHGCWLFPLILMLAQLVNIIIFVMSPGAFSSMP